MATLEELVVRIDADTRGLKTQLNALQKQLEKTDDITKKLKREMLDFGKNVLAGVTFGKFISDLKQSINYLDDMADSADRVGISSEEFSKLSYAAKNTEVDIATLEISLRKMQLAFVEAENAGSGAANAFGQLGLKAEELRSVGADEALLRIADALARVEDPARRAAYQQEIFGRGSIKLNDLLKEGSESIRKYYQEAERLGLVVGGDAADRAEKFKRSLVQLQGAYQGALIQLADTGALENLISLFVKLANALNYVAEGVNNFRSNIGFLSNATSIKMLEEKVQRAQINLEQSRRIFENPESHQGVKWGVRSVDSVRDQALTNMQEAMKALNDAKREYKSVKGDIIAGGGKIQTVTADMLGGDIKKTAARVGGATGATNTVNNELTKPLEEAEDTADELRKKINDISTNSIKTLGDELVDALQRGESAGEALWSSFKYTAIRAIADIGAEFLRQKLSSGASGAGGSFGGFGSILSDIGSGIWDALPSFNGGGYTGNGSGGGVDGKGGFPALLHPNETVVPGRGGDSGGQFVQNVIINATSQQEIDRRIMQQVPMIAQAASDLVESKMSRGGSMSAQVGRRI